MRDIMVDIETLGTKPGSVILSIGAVAFDVDSGELGQTYYDVVSIASALTAGATIDPATLAWWSTKPPEAQKVIFEALGGGEDMAVAIDRFAGFLSGQSEPRSLRLWGNGSDFDNVLLVAAFAQVRATPPWRFFNHRCFRTLKSLFPGREPTRDGVHHNALDDALHQARWALAIAKSRSAL